MPNGRYPRIIIAICVTLFSVSQLTEIEAQNKQQVSVLGEGHGVDHVVIPVRDLESAKDTYRDTLGFSVPPLGMFGVHPTGTKNSAAFFEDGSYLELLAVNDSEKVKLNRPWFLTFLEKHEGAMLLALNVSSAEGTVRFLRARGLEVSDPDSGTILTASGTKVPPPAWWIVRFTKPILPADPIFFIQDASAAAREEFFRRAVAAGRTRHANTAKRVAAVWIVVRDLEAATKAFEAAGLDAADTRQFPMLGAAGREIGTPRGKIVLLWPNGKTEKAASFLSERGEGIMGISLEVSSLETARAVMEKNTKRSFGSYVGFYGDSILIPAALAHGVWIEMFQNAR